MKSSLHAGSAYNTAWPDGLCNTPFEMTFVILLLYNSIDIDSRLQCLPELNHVPWHFTDGRSIYQHLFVCHVQLTIPLTCERPVKPRKVKGQEVIAVRSRNTDDETTDVDRVLQLTEMLTNDCI